MALRLIEMILSKESGEEVGNLLKDQQLVEYWQIPFPDGDVMVRILLDAEQNEDVLDLLEKKYACWKGNRLVMFPVSATLPREEELPAVNQKFHKTIKESRYGKK